MDSRTVGPAAHRDALTQCLCCSAESDGTSAHRKRQSEQTTGKHGPKRRSQQCFSLRRDSGPSVPVPVPVRSVPVSAGSQFAGPWSGSLQHTHNSLGWDQCCPAGPFPVPEATQTSANTKNHKQEQDNLGLAKVYEASVINRDHHKCLLHT